MSKHWQIPREHGAWGMLYIPLLLGLIAAWQFPWRSLLLIAAATFAFLARAPLQAWVRASHWGTDSREPARYALAYLIFATTLGGWLIVGWQLWGLLLPIAAGTGILALNLYQSVQRTEKTLAGEVMAAGAMALTGPAAYYAAVRFWSFEALGVWALSVAFFTSGILYVKLRIAAMHEKTPGERARLQMLCADYHLLLAVSLIVLVSAGMLGPLAAAGFAPVIARGLWSSFGRPGRIELRRAGWLEVAWSLVFLVCAGAWLAIT
jgi:hypothetical protein